MTYPAIVAVHDHSLMPWPFIRVFDIKALRCGMFSALFNKCVLFLLVLKYCNWLTACVRWLGVWQVQKISETPQETTTKKGGQSSCRLQRVQLEDVVIGGCGEEELLLAGRPVITGTVKPQCPLKVQELTHEVKVWGNVGLLPLDEVISIIERKVESLHQVGHGDRDWATDSGQAVDQDPALFRSSLICERENYSQQKVFQGQVFKYCRHVLAVFR